MLVSFLYSPKTLHLAFQSGFRRTACQRRSSRGRLAGTLWPDQDQDNDDDDDFEGGLILKRLFGRERIDYSNMCRNMD